MVGPEVRGPVDPTSTGRTTPAWDSNLLDPAQVIEVMEIRRRTTGRPTGPLPAPTKIERRNARLWKNLG